MRITHIEPRSVLAYAVVLGCCMFVLDLVVVALLWVVLTAMGIFSALSIGLGLTTMLAIGILLGAAHAAATAILVWVAGIAFNLSVPWTGGFTVRSEEPVVLPDTAQARFGAAPGVGVASPSVSSARATVDVKHEG